MAAFLRRPNAQLAAVTGKLLSSRYDQTGSRILLGGTLCGPGAVGQWRGSGVPFSSWVRGTRTWGHHSDQRPEIAKWGDWACLGLTALAGGLFWTSSTSREEVPSRESLLHIVLLYGALKYSLKRKLLRLRLKWLRHKLVLRGLVLKEFERENKACLGEVDNILQGLEIAMLYKMENFNKEAPTKAHACEVDNVLQGLEDGILFKMENATKKIPIQSGDPFLISASTLLQRIEKLKEIVSRKLEGSNNSVLHMDFDDKATGWAEVQLSRIEVLVRQLVKSHAVTDARIRRNKELTAKVDDLIVSLEPEK